MATIHLKLIGFNAIEFLQSKNTFALTEALRHHKHLSRSLIAVGAIIIDKSLDKLVKTRDVKLSMKGWRDGSQTQRAWRVWHKLCRGHCDFGRGPHYRTVFARWAIQPPTDPTDTNTPEPTSQLCSHSNCMTICLLQNLRWWRRECWTGNFYSGKRKLSPIRWVW